MSMFFFILLITLFVSFVKGLFMLYLVVITSLHITNKYAKLLIFQLNNN